VKQCVKIKVTGRVQGVLYREFVKKHAQKLSIEGTIKNNEDKQSVSILASGPAENLDDFIDQLYKGSPKSSIDNVEVEPLLLGKNFRNVFRIIGNE